MRVYHEVAPDSLDAILKEGLKRSPRGDKGDDPAIKKTDALLDAHRPASLKKVGVSHNKSIYAYVEVKGFLIDITDGMLVSREAFIRRSNQQVLELFPDADHCFVSDLDMFDVVKSAVMHQYARTELEDLARRYWSRVVPLAKFDPAFIRRPEVMITTDIPPSAISIARPVDA